MTTVEKRFAVGLAVLALLWLGLLLGVSFLATPVKFLAPSLSLPVALDVGRQTFAALNPLELLLAIVLLLTAFVALRKTGAVRAPAVMASSLLALVLFQSLWLLPALDARVEIIIQGDVPPPSQLHSLYIVVDVIKLGLLTAVATLGIRDLLR